MGHSITHTLEESEHAKHHAADPFDKRVAMSMAIVAAALAFVAMLSHRAHNHVLLYQNEATGKFVEASDTWAQYQSKRIRAAMFEDDAEILATLTSIPQVEGKPQATKQIEKWRAKLKEYAGTEDPDSLPNLQKKATEFTKERDALRKKADEVHHHANFLDAGHLGIELALVLCSVAVLTKQRSFWYFGVVTGVIGFAIAMLSFAPSSWLAFLPH